MIGDTLYACLTGEERRNHELYFNDKISLLYKLILEDSGSECTIERLIIQLNDKAKHAIEEEEKRKRRNAQPADPSIKVDDTDEQSNHEGTVAEGSVDQQD